jgi:ribosomal RNA methyltransferase Nop2
MGEGRSRSMTPRSGQRSNNNNNSNNSSRGGGGGRGGRGGRSGRGGRGGNERDRRSRSLSSSARPGQQSNNRNSLSGNTGKGRNNNNNAVVVNNNKNNRTQNNNKKRSVSVPPPSKKETKEAEVAILVTKKKNAKVEESPVEPSDDDDDDEEENSVQKKGVGVAVASASSDEDDDLDEGDKEENDDDDDDDDKEEDDEDDENEDDDDDDKEEDDEDAENEEEDDMPAKGKFFSDENAAWLKPKDQNNKKKEKLLDSDDEDEDDEDIGDDDDEMKDELDDDDSDEEMEVEKQSRLLDARNKEEEEEADEELRTTVATHTAIYHLPTKEELDKDVDRVVPPSELKSHVESILEVLASFQQRREPGRSRKEYVDQLGLFIAELYGYLPELIEYFLTMFSPSEALEFVEYSDKPRPLVIRTNTLKTRRKDLAMALMKRGVALDPLASWSKVGLKIMDSPVPIGATPEYLSGHYMLQSAASMCPVLALNPQPKERVLDMSAAPGGKTSYIAQLMRNTGVVFANDLKPDRQKATAANMHRLGVKNVITCTHDGRKLAKHFGQFKFDRVLLDAPCSGLGVISRDPSCKVQRTLVDVQKTAHLQKELLLAAIDVLNHKSKTGGVMVYSTCSVSVLENEEVVNYALQKRDIKIVDTELDFGKSKASF